MSTTDKKLHIITKVKEKLENRVAPVLKYMLREGYIPELDEQRLLKAVITNNTELVHRLLDKGVDANTTDLQQRSALHLAASRGYADVVQLLLLYKADANKQDVVGNTPLHLAACTGNLQIITLLLNAGADVCSLDVHNRNPLQVARSKLQILKNNWECGTIEMIQLRTQLEQIIDVMISLTKNKNLYAKLLYDFKFTAGDLETIKVSISEGKEDIDQQMEKISTQLQGFSLL